MPRGKVGQPQVDGARAALVGAGERTGVIDISLLIPAYNEEDRLPATLDAVLRFLDGREYSWEVIVADDGSDDATPQITEQAAAKRDNVHHLRLTHRGKAAAIRAGVDVAVGRFVIFTDADLSTPIEYVDEAHRLLTTDWDIVIGSREAQGAQRIDEPAYRHVMGRFYNRIVQMLALPGISDSQCGFKGFRAEVVQDLFREAYLYRNGVAPVHGPLVTGFDVELLFLARKRGYRIYELPVTWRHVEGSKVHPGLDSVRMLRDVLWVRLNDLRGRYRNDSL